MEETIRFTSSLLSLFSKSRSSILSPHFFFIRSSSWIFNGPQVINTSIIWPVFVDAYKHLKIVYAQSRMSKVCANTSKIQHSFYPDLGANNAQHLLGYKPNIRKLNLMHFTPPSGFLASYFVTFLTLKWLYYSFTIDDAISSSIFMRLYNKLVISIMWDVELGVPTSTSLEF
jgi:hypothetical protein